MSEWEMAGRSDDWFTPAYIFDALGCRFDVDVAAPEDGPRHVPCEHWISKDSLDADWRGQFCWMNPPFGGRNGLIPWLDKFAENGNGIALTPDRTSAPWFQGFAKKVDMMLFLSPKVKFERPDGSVGKSPGSGTVLHAIGLRGIAALTNAASKGAGLIVVPWMRSSA